MRKMAILKAIIMIIASLFSLCACNATDTIAPIDNAKCNGNQETVLHAKVVDDFTPNDVVYDMSEALAFSASDEDIVGSKTVCATVLPEDAKDKSVTWSIAWESMDCTYDIAEYFRLDIEYTGSNTVNVVCLKPYYDIRATLTVTTNIGGFSDSIFVKYSGTTVALTTNFPYEKVTEYYDPQNPLKSGSAVREVYNITADYSLNTLLMVSCVDRYGNIIRESSGYSLKSEAIGNFNVKLTKSNMTNTSPYETTEISSEIYSVNYLTDLVSLNSNIKYVYTGLKTFDTFYDYVYHFDCDGISQNFSKYHLDQRGAVHLYKTHALSGYSGLVICDDSGDNGDGTSTTYSLSFHSYNDGDDYLPYMSFTVYSENDSSICVTYNVRIVSDVEGVSISDGSMYFY